KPSNYLTDGSLKFNVENFDFLPYQFNTPTTEEPTSFLENKKNYNIILFLTSIFFFFLQNLNFKIIKIKILGQKTRI
uniref:hypothetical protein n=1 Tax=Mesomycoplasma ovipneumoniae TaxID=29562 RepID=UPI003080586A